MSGAAWDDEELAARRVEAYHRLAKLTNAEYTRVRKEEALSLGMPVAELDAAVTKARRAKHAPGAWQNDLIVTVTGSPKPCVANVIMALQCDPAWEGVLRLDEFAQRIEISGPPWEPKAATRALRDEDATRAATWLQREHGIIAPTPLVWEAIIERAFANRFHPVRTYLKALPSWDRTPRIETWLVDHLGAADTPLNRAIGSRFLISAVARVLRPGCKVDTCLILEGRQSLRKSTALRVLAGDKWFTDQGSEIGSKDAKAELSGVWIREIAEFTSFKRSDTDMIKAFLSTQEDRFRPSYGRLVAQFPRQVVFAATINPDGMGYLKDPTGARRFWCVACEQGWEPRRKIDTEALAAVRDQLWAEAYLSFMLGDPWWLDSDDLEAAQEAAADERFEADAWDGLVDAYLEEPVRAFDGQIVSARREQVTIADLLRCVGLAPGEWTRARQMTVGAIMARRKGWVHRRVARPDGARERVYERVRLRGEASR